MFTTRTLVISNLWDFLSTLFMRQQVAYICRSCLSSTFFEIFKKKFENSKTFWKIQKIFFEKIKNFLKKSKFLLKNSKTFWKVQKNFLKNSKTFFENSKFFKNSKNMSFSDLEQGQTIYGMLKTEGQDIWSMRS